MRVAILTTFRDFDPSYSLVGVALEQCAMLLEHDVDFNLFVLEEKALNKASINSIEWIQPHLRREVPTARLEEDIINSEHVGRVADFLRKIVPEYDVIITHDWMFTTWNVNFNAAVREVAVNNPGSTWVHWVHSAPAERPGRIIGAAKLRYEEAPNSIYVYLNEADRLRYAESMGLDIGKVNVCYNPMDITSFLGIDSPFVRKHRLFDHDLMQVYPFSMPRAETKGIGKVAGVFGGFKKLGFKVKLVFVNCHCNASREKAQVEAYSDMARRDFGLTSDDLIWTSKEEGWDYSVPHDIVKKLLMMSNIFVFPTASEACSRILQEASLAGCLVIGNESFKPMFEFLAPQTPRHTFGSLRENVTYSIGEGVWLDEVAKATLPLLNHPIMKQKTHMMRLAARETVWRDQFLPILERAKQMARVTA